MKWLFKRLTILYYLYPPCDRSKLFTKQHQIEIYPIFFDSEALTVESSFGGTNFQITQQEGLNLLPNEKRF